MRRTKETDIHIQFNIDGTGKYTIDTNVPFLNHMLELFALHGMFDLRIKATGDVNADDHHTVEDIGICLGKALKKALGKSTGIKRYGSASIPMDEALVQVSVDVSGRPYLVYNFKPRARAIKGFDVGLFEDFWIAFANNAGITIHINLIYGRNTHHIIEAIFKGVARALDIATSPDGRIRKIPSTKGCI